MSENDAQGPMRPPAVKDDVTRNNQLQVMVQIDQATSALETVRSERNVIVGRFRDHERKLQAQIASLWQEFRALQHGELMPGFVMPRPDGPAEEGASPAAPPAG